MKLHVGLQEESSTVRDQHVRTSVRQTLSSDECCAAVVVALSSLTVLAVCFSTVLAHMYDTVHI